MGVNRSLYVARRRARYTFRGLALLTGIGHTKIFAIEHGHVRPSEVEARVLAAALRVPVSEIMPDETAKAARRG